MSAFAQKRPDSEKLAEAARRAGDGCGAVQLVREQSGGFARKSGTFSIERCVNTRLILSHQELLNLLHMGGFQTLFSALLCCSWQAGGFRWFLRLVVT